MKIADLYNDNEQLEKVGNVNGWDGDRSFDVGNGFFSIEKDWKPERSNASQKYVGSIVIHSWMDPFPEDVFRVVERLNAIGVKVDVSIYAAGSFHDRWFYAVFTDAIGAGDSPESAEKEIQAQYKRSAEAYRRSREFDENMGAHMTLADLFVDQESLNKLGWVKSRNIRPVMKMGKVTPGQYEGEHTLAVGGHWFTFDQRIYGDKRFVITSVNLTGENPGEIAATKEMLHKLNALGLSIIVSTWWGSSFHDPRYAIVFEDGRGRKADDDDIMNTIRAADKRAAELWRMSNDFDDDDDVAEGLIGLNQKLSRLIRVL